MTTDTRTGLSHYTVRVAITPAEVGRIGAIKLVPGMPVETFIESGDRSVASYFIKPMIDQAKRRVPRRLTNEVLKHARAYAPSNALTMRMAFVCQGSDEALGALPFRVGEDIP